MLPVSGRASHGNVNTPITVTETKEYDRSSSIRVRMAVYYFNCMASDGMDTFHSNKDLENCPSRDGHERKTRESSCWYAVAKE